MRFEAALLGVSLALTVTISGPVSALGQELEIIHTNDLHSFLEHGDDDSTGGYAAVSALISQLKAQAQARGIETLTLDAGDFTEGTPFYMAGDGTDSMRLMMKMGYDALAVGNHEWLVGAQQMDWIFGSVAPGIPILSANFHVSSSYANLNRYIQPSTELTRAGLRIGIFGLSTNDELYSWRLPSGTLGDPNEAAEKEVRKLRDRNDLVIALTHIGVDADENLASNVPGIDLIVGGHSHTVLQQPVMVKNPRGVEVPIVQTGAHGDYVGDMLLDYEPGKPVQIESYQLVPVPAQPQDPVIEQGVESARHDLEDRYGADWLYHVVGMSDAQMTSPEDNPTAWGNFYEDAIREAVGADMALDSSEFFGDNQPAGPITREMLMNFYPRYFDLTKPMGWTVWTIDVPGWLLKLAIEIEAKDGGFYDLSQCTYDLDGSDVKNIKIDGKNADDFKTYHVAVTEGLGLGAEDINWFLKIFFRPKDSGIPVWQAVEDEITREGGVISLKDRAVNRLPAGIHWKPARVDRLLNLY